jgi:hypothetical protein
MHRCALAVLASLTALLTLPAASFASGAESIAEAPPLALGGVESAGGHYIDFWRTQLFSGDVVTVDADLSTYDADILFNLYAPTVNDYTLSQAEPIAETGYLSGGKQQFTLRSSVTGLGTLAVCRTEDRTCDNGGAGDEPPFTFTASVTHAVSLAIAAPILARPKSRITVSAVVQSPAGTPEGACLIQGAEAPLTDGHCTLRVRLGRSGRQTVRVSFVPDDGWQEASGTRHIRLARSHARA